MSVDKKLILVGDEYSGKTCLLTMFTQGKFLEDYIPTVCDTNVATMELDNGNIVKLLLWDTSGQGDYDLGTKDDLRSDLSELELLQKKGYAPVTTAEAEAVAKKIKAVAYIECSAKTKFNVSDVFEAAARAPLDRKSRLAPKVIQEPICLR
ncbi:Ras domain containing protein [Asbolus verrucosus]|uniref:Ras domain containing protein n=1 Tax=Asbolus verrucosus TaxID=1661398 RepID=A0A482WDE1_ASBVE|nr:Ras domain containing protein [Asbolus verrucosus]